MKAIKQDLCFVINESSRCLYCVDAPCAKQCPASIDIPQFIRHLRFSDIKSAKKVIKDANPFGGICGYICPSEELCQGKCVYNKVGVPIKIRELQKFVCDNNDYKICHTPALNGKKVAIIGAGPAGISCAVELGKAGFEVTVYEKQKKLGGTIVKEIPEFRIPVDVIEKELGELALDNVKYVMDREVNAKQLKDELLNVYDAIFISTGLTDERDFGAKVASRERVFNASEFLTKIKSGILSGVNGTVYVIGGGDTAVDVARTAMRYGAEKAVIAYRRTKEQMPATDEEFLNGALEGVEVMYLVSPVEIKGEGELSITFVRNRLVESEGSLRKGFEVVKDSEFELKADYIVFAVGKKASRDFIEEHLGGSLSSIDKKSFRVDDSKLFVGGDFANGGKTVVQAVGEGKAAAKSIMEFLK